VLKQPPLFLPWVITVILTATQAADCAEARLLSGAARSEGEAAVKTRTMPGSAGMVLPGGRRSQVKTYAPANGIQAMPGRARAIAQAQPSPLAAPVGSPAAPAGQVEPSEAPSIDDLIGKVFLAYGGKYALGQVNGPLIEYGTKKEIAGDGETELLAYRHVRKAGRFRIDLSSPPGTQGGTTANFVCAYDGGNIWKSADGEVYAVPQAQATATLQEEEQRPSILCQFHQPGVTFVYAGRTTYRQIPVFAIEVTRQGQAPANVFVDQNNYLVVGTSYRGVDPQSGLTANLANDFTQYRPQGGTLVPFRQVRYVNDRMVSEINLESVAFAPKIDDASFNRPGERATLRLTRSETVPIQYSHGEIVMKVRLNDGEPLEFLFDTGASDTIVDRRTAAEHYLDKQGSMSIAAASSAVSTNSSIIRKLELGNTALSDVPALILDLTPQSRQLGRPIAGIIGHNVISQFATTIDYGKSAVVLSDASSYAPPEGVAVVPFTDRRGPVVIAILNGRDEESFLVDTGAAFNHLPAQVARRYVKEEPQHLTEGTGLDGRPVRLGTLAIDSVTLGAQRVKDVSFTFPAQQEAPRGQGGFFQTSNIGILGNPFWQNFAVTLDYKFRRLVLRSHQPARTRQDVRQLVTTGDAQLIMHRDYRAADVAYRSGLASAQAAGDAKGEAKFLGRLGNLYRVMSRDLNRPELAKGSYDFFTKAQTAARKAGDREIEGRILADWSLLYSDRGQAAEARTMIASALQLSPQDAQVNVDYAVHLYRAKLFAEMQKFVDKALFLDPTNWQALWYQVKLSETFFDTPRVVSTLKEILRFYPWSKLAREKLTALAPQLVPQPSPSGSKPQKPASSAPLSSPAKPLITPPAGNSARPTNILPANR